MEQDYPLSPGSASELSPLRQHKMEINTTTFPLPRAGPTNHALYTGTVRIVILCRDG